MGQGQSVKATETGAGKLALWPKPTQPVILSKVLLGHWHTHSFIASVANFSLKGLSTLGHKLPAKPKIYLLFGPLKKKFVGPCTGLICPVRGVACTAAVVVSFVVVEV